MKLVSLLAAALMLLCIGCATANKISGVQVGMTKAEVIKTMGTPTSSSAHGADLEYLNYALAETSDDAFWGATKPYFVRLVKGRVDAFGRHGDFDSTKTPTVRVETDSTIKTSATNSGNTDLFNELQRLKALKDDGTLTEEEFIAAKKKVLNK